MVPPSLLEARPLWPVAHRDTLSPAAAPEAAEEQMEPKIPKSSPKPQSPIAVTTESAPGRSAAPEGLAALFQQQIAVLDAHLAIIRQQNEILSHGGATPAGLAPIPALAALAPNGNGFAGEVSAPAGNGHEPAAHAGNGGPVPYREASVATGNGQEVVGNGHPRVVAKPAAPANGHGTHRPPVEPRSDGGDLLAQLEGKVIQVVARITAHSPARLGPATRLGGDLGFDSLMVVELVSGLQELVPDAEPLSRATFAEDLSIADVARHLHRSLGKAAPAPKRVVPPSARGEEIRRYTVTFEARPLPAAGAGLPLPPVVLLGDQSGVAEALRQRLERRKVRAQVVADDPGDIAAGATVIDLRGLGDGTGQAALPGADDLRGAALGAFALARRLDGTRPATLLFVHRGLGTSAVAGLAKSLGREWPESRVLAVEVEADAPPEQVADALVAELGGGETAGEVRYLGAARLVPVLRPAPLPVPAPGLPEGVVVAISGGGSGLGARLARTLARRCHAKLVLLGRRPSSPETEALLDDLRAAGGRALYLPCNVRDPAAVATACAHGRQAFGPIQLAVHAAGVIEDAPVGRKDQDGFTRVFDTKVGGALALWSALAQDPLSVFLLYASWAGRFGNAHQSDYSAANHALARLAEALPAGRPEVRVCAVDLPPWEGSNMFGAVPEAIRAEMRARGVSFLSDEVGLDRLMAELSSPAAPSGEVLLGGTLPPRTVPVALRSRLSVQAQPYLDDHRIGDRPVLPMAAAVDLLLAAARGAGVPGEGEVTAVHDLAVVKGVILAEGGGDVVARASASERVDGSREGTADGEAITELLAVGQRSTVSYRARISRGSGWLPAVTTSTEQVAITLPLSEFYARHTFHGPRLRAVDEVLAVGAGHIEGRIQAASAGGGASPWLLAVDGALQLCAYWAVIHHGRIGLPVGVAEMRLRSPLPAGTRLVCRAALAGREGDRFEGDLDLLTEDGEPVVQIRGLRAELVVGVESPVVESTRYRIEEFPEVKELQTKIEFARAAGIDIPYFRTLDACTGATALIEGREYLNFTSYNYVGLSGHPRIAEAVTQAVKRYGTSVSASRVTGGQKPIHNELEQELAKFLGTEAALVMVGGHSTNVSVIGHLFGPEDLILHDSLAHDSILGGARLAGARRRPFPHNDHEALGRILREVRPSVRRVLIAVEGVYSMDGDITPLPPIIALKKKYGAMLFVDEAHSLGVLGRTGRGVGEHYGVDRRDVEIWMGTMSKTLASCGGYIAGSAVLTEYLKYTVPGFIYSVGMSPSNAAAALTALRILNAEPERARTCQDRARFFLRLCKDRGIDTGESDQSSVVPCIVGNSYAAIRLAEALLRRGIHVHPIIYPAVSETMARLRFFITAAHSEEQLRVTADALAEELTKLSLLPRAAEAESLEPAAPLPRGVPGEVS
jgi:8-amino-7-oxononanoate synthase